MVEIQYLLFNANHIGLKCPLIVWPGGGGIWGKTSIVHFFRQYQTRIFFDIKAVLY